MAANEFYLALKMGADNNIGNVIATTSTNAGPGNGTASDVELRIQTDPGTGPNNITKQLVIEKLIILKEFIEGGGLNGAGAGLPAL